MLISKNTESIFSEIAPEAVGPYPHAKRYGELIFVSGIGPRERGKKEIPGVTLSPSGEVESYDIEVQTRSVIENIRTILQVVGCDLGDIIDAQCFLTDIMNDFKKFNKVYSEYFNAETGPSRTTIGVTGLPTPIAVEMKVVARSRQ
ncbi:RidA family protein [bacterium]|nr:RidA family protein [bacterium]